jgi:hypothetical protein
MNINGVEAATRSAPERTVRYHLISDDEKTSYAGRTKFENNSAEKSFWKRQSARLNGDGV